MGGIARAKPSSGRWACPSFQVADQPARADDRRPENDGDEDGRRRRCRPRAFGRSAGPSASSPRFQIHGHRCRSPAHRPASPVAAVGARRSVQVRG